MRLKPKPAWKKQISVFKFLRIAHDPRSVKVKGLYSAALHVPEMDQAIEAYKIDNFLYMFRKCKKQNGNRLKTYFVRYNLDNPNVKKEYVITGGRV